MTPIGPPSVCLEQVVLAVHHGYSSLEDVLTLISVLHIQLFSSILFSYTLMESVI